MSAYQADFKELIRERADIVEIIGDYTALNKKGKDWRGPCPLHGGKNPSNFAVDAEKGTFKCFSDCGKGGDLFSFVMEIEGVDFPGACRILAQRLGIPIPERRARLSSEQRRRRDAQGSWSGNASRWEDLGIRDSAAAFQLGFREGSDASLLLPVWGGDDWSHAPGGWLTYQSEGGAPVPAGLDTLSREGLAGTVFISPAARSAVRQQLLLFCVDPVVCVRLHEVGYRASCSVISPMRDEESAWLRVEDARTLRERLSGRIGRIGLVVPAEGVHLRALHATEVALLEAGIEPILIRTPECEELVHGWTWAASASKAEDIADYVRRDRFAVDVFDLRIRLLRPLIIGKRITVSEAVAKLVPSLRGVVRSNPVLYELCVAWALGHLPGLRRDVLETAVKVGDSGDDSVQF